MKSESKSRKKLIKKEQRKKQEQHRQALKKIADHPEKFGIYNVIGYEIEKPLSKDNKMIARPDLVFHCSDGIHLIEYKTNGGTRSINRATKQLTTALKWYQKNQNKTPIVSLIYRED